MTDKPTVDFTTLKEVAGEIIACESSYKGNDTVTFPFNINLDDGREFDVTLTERKETEEEHEHEWSKTPYKTAPTPKAEGEIVEYDVHCLIEGCEKKAKEVYVWSCYVEDEA